MSWMLKCWDLKQAVYSSTFTFYGIFEKSTGNTPRFVESKFYKNLSICSFDFINNKILSGIHEEAQEDDIHDKGGWQ
jgi:hypothetical protein